MEFVALVKFSLQKQITVKSKEINQNKVTRDRTVQTT